MLRTQLRQIIEESDWGWGRFFDLSIQVLIILSLTAFAVETLPDLSDSTRQVLRTFELICIGIFSAEYVLRLWVAERRFGFVTSFFGIVDLLAILPFYLALGIDIRSIRVFRLLRLFRVLKLARYSAAIRRFHRAFVLAKEELVLFFVVTTMLLYLAAVGIYYFEHPVQPEAFRSIFHSLWWAVATLTTVGYGDIYPITAGGRFFTFVILLGGLGVIAVPPGLVASALSKARQMEESQDSDA